MCSSDLDVVESQGELCQEGELSSLPVGFGIRDTLESAQQRLVVREDGEGAALQEMAEVEDSCVHCQKLSVESTVGGFRRGKFPGEKSQRPPVLAWPPLLQGCAYVRGGGVGDERKISSRAGVDQES